MGIEARGETTGTGMVVFDPSIQSVHVGNREFMLKLQLAEDGTGLAKIYELHLDGRRSYVVCGFRNHVSRGWEIASGGYVGSGATVREAAVQFLRSLCGI